jgi:malate permease and related proteins
MTGRASRHPEVSQFLIKLIPLYVFVALGFFAGRILSVRKEAIAPLLIYVIMPLVLFRGAITVALEPARLWLPVIVYTLCCTMCLVTTRLGRGCFAEPARHILGFGAGNANSGYFGLPVAVALLGEQAFSQAVMISFGFIFFENTLGFYMAARGRHSKSDALKKVLTLPSAYAFAIGVALRAFHVTLPEETNSAFDAIRGTYTVLGMMLVGLALSDIRSFEKDARFLTVALGAKHVVWPLLVLCVLAVDGMAAHVFDDLARRGLLLASLLPMAANTVAIAAVFDAEPEKTSLAVVISTLLAVILLPALVPWL